jgi:hypothetical protein
MTRRPLRPWAGPRCHDHQQHPGHPHGSRAQPSPSTPAHHAAASTTTLLLATMMTAHCTAAHWRLCPPALHCLRPSDRWQLCSQCQSTGLLWVCQCAAAFGGTAFGVCVSTAVCVPSIAWLAHAFGPLLVHLGTLPSALAAVAGHCCSSCGTETMGGAFRSFNSNQPVGSSSKQYCVHAASAACLDQMQGCLCVLQDMKLATL